jgi:muramoyltetrapeptide carboxypeptidase LdcA involved in peptidoglycan recycling
MRGELAEPTIDGRLDCHASLAMTIPKFDNANAEVSKVYVVAPASGVHNSPSKDWRKYMEDAKNMLSTYGIQITYHYDMICDTVPIFFAPIFFASDSKFRIEDFARALDHDSRIIWAFRGGYGSIDVAISMMNYKSVGIDKKILIGMSDITALHILFNQHFGIPSIHAHGLYNAINHHDDLKYTLDILYGKSVTYQMLPKNDACSNHECEGEIIGGNLTIMSKLIGTALHPNTTNKILLLEDVAEKGYEIHRYLTHLFYSGIFTNIEAVIFGDFVKTDENCSDAINDFINNYIPHVPCYHIENVGHGDHNMAIVLGSPVSIRNAQLYFGSPYA